MDGWLLTSIKHICIFDPGSIVMFLAISIYSWHYLLSGKGCRDRQRVGGFRQVLCRGRVTVVTLIIKLRWRTLAFSICTLHSEQPLSAGHVALNPNLGVLFSLCWGLSIDGHSRFILTRKFFKQLSKFSLNRFKCLLNTTSSQPLSNNGCSGMYITATLLPICCVRALWGIEMCVWALSGGCWWKCMRVVLPFTYQT